MDFQSGQILNGMYQIVSRIGAGGGGVVYKAVHLRLQTDVVVKKIKDSALDKLTIRQEADILKRLKHPYLPRVYDFVETPEAVYTVMDYIPGISLNKALEQRGRFTVEEVFKWAGQLGEALSYLHSQKPAIIHGDIKPANIMLTPDGNVCLIDFNIALACGSNQYASVGISAHYSPPEQYSDSNFYAQVTSRYTNLPVTHTASSAMGHFGKGISARSDIYALGATLYHLLTGTAPTQEFDKIAPLSLYDLPMGEGFCYVIEKMMSISPQDRYKDGVEYLDALRNCYKLDAAYRAKRRKALIIQITIMAVIAGMFVAAFGVFMISRRMAERKYQALIQDAEQALEDMDYDAATEYIEDAKEQKDSRIEAYCIELRLLYEEMEYEACVDRAEKYLNGSYFRLRDQDEEMLGDIYYVTGNAYLEMEDYQNAKDALECALDHNQKNGLYYRDYAIVLARIGKIDKAEKQLEEAIDHDLAEDSIYMVQAEIALSKGEYKEGIENLEETLSLTDDRQMEMRCYFLLAKANIKLAQENPDDADKYHSGALDALDALEDMGVHTYRVQESTAVIYEQMGEFEEAEKRLLKLADDYPKRYEVYSRLAYLEIDKQSQLPNEERDYHQAEEYYEKAQELYQGEEDAEMDVLDQMMKDIRDGGWL